MKTARTCIFIAAAIAAGFLTARWCAAQPSERLPNKQPRNYDFGALDQLAAFVAHLQETKQTNTLQRFNDLETASLTSRQLADLGVTLAILQRLRDGRTNEAYELLEGRLDTDILGFVRGYRDLPPSSQDQKSLKTLERARDYRAKHPFKHRYQNVDEGVVEAFKLLDEKGK